MSQMENKQKIVMEAGEIKVNRNDVLVATKLKLLGQAGYSIVDAWHDGDGFRLLLTRPFAEKKEDRADYAGMIAKEKEAGKKGLHAEGPRCPQYCGCMTYDENKKENEFVSL